VEEKGKIGAEEEEEERDEQQESSNQKVSLVKEVALHAYNNVLREVRNPVPLAIDSFANFIPGIAVGFPQLAIEVYKPPLPLDLALLCPAIIRERCVGQAIEWTQVVFGGFFVTMIMSFGGAIYAVKTFGKYGAVLKRQLQSGASPLAYFIAQNLVDLIHIFRIAFIFASGYMIIASPRGSFGDWLGMCFVQQFTIFGLGYIISLVVKYENAPIVLAVVVVGNAVFSGASPSLDTVNGWGPLIAVWAVSYNRWTAESNVILQTRGQDWARVDDSLVAVGYNPNNFALDLGITLVIGVVFRLIAWAIFWYRSRKVLRS